MPEDRGLFLSDFKRVNLGKGYYLQAIVGEYEFTLEPHLVAGFSVGIYLRNRPVAVEKRAVWMRNHPEDVPPDLLQQSTIERAVMYANQLYSKYILYVE
jgi:hypothetical protein